MKTFHHLTLLGTSHIAQQSIQEVSQAIHQLQPHLIALELDASRYYALTHRKKRKTKLSDLPHIGLKGYLFASIGAYLQKKLGEIVHVQPGSEMLTAIKLAKQNKIKIALIDQPLQVTLKRFSEEFTFKEKLRFLADLFKGLFFRKRELKKYGLNQFDLTKVPPQKLIRKLIRNLKKRYPSLYKVLIQERNQVIARNLFHLMQKNPQEKILAVVGAGHEVEIINLLKKYFRKAK